MVPFLKWKACTRHRVRKRKGNLQKASKRMSCGLWELKGFGFREKSSA